jgi:hypothetical protein
MIRGPKRDGKKSLFEAVESLTQNPGQCNLLSNFLPQIGLRGVERELLAEETVSSRQGS